MSGDVAPYLALITSEHRGAQRFVDTVSLSVQPLADDSDTLMSMASAFDLDVAVGAQLDAIGLWVGIGRQILTTTYDDDQYRQLLRAKILRNNWDGSINGAYAVWDRLFYGWGKTIYIVDNQDMTMDLGVVEGPPDAVTLALLTGDYISLRPVGVGIKGYYYPTSSRPAFWWGPETSNHKGWGGGDWLKYVRL